VSRLVIRFVDGRQGRVRKNLAGVWRTLSDMKAERQQEMEGLSTESTQLERTNVERDYSKEGRTEWGGGVCQTFQKKGLSFWRC